MKDHPKIRLFNVINGIIFILISIIMLIPIYKVLVDSFDLSSAYGMRLWPKQFGLAGYESVLSNPTLYRPLLISVEQHWQVPSLVWHFLHLVHMF